MIRSENMIAYTENKKRETINTLQRAIDTMKAQGKKITRKELIEESGLSSAVLSKPYIKEVLKENKVLMYQNTVVMKEGEAGSNTLMLKENNKLRREVQRLEHKILDYELVINDKKTTVKKEKEKYKELQVKYERLLGKWQKLLEYLQRTDNVTPQIKELFKF